MDAFVLKELSWWQTQCYYHALAELGREGLILCYPREAYVSLGIHDDLAQEVDVAYCRQAGLPLIRRKIGGGVVLLDRQQVFYQVVLRRDHPLLGRRQGFLETMLTPARQVLEKLQVPAVYRPPADLVCDGRKFTGSGVGEIGDCVAFAGNILLDFDVKKMVALLRTPNPLYASLLADAMAAHIGTVRQYCKSRIPFNLFTNWLCAYYEPILGELIPKDLDEELMAMAATVKQELTSQSWLAKRGRRSNHRKVKIREDVYMHQIERDRESCIILTEGERVVSTYRLVDGEAVVGTDDKDDWWRQAVFSSPVQLG